MADPEQIYQEVLTEEQGKGVSAPVAEGRAKAARARAEAGSPHPTEPKWWPGAQPHLEGGDAAPSDEPAEEPAEAEPAQDETVEAAAQDEPAEAAGLQEERAEETPAATEEVQAPQVPQEQAPPPAEPALPAPDAAQPAAAAAAAPEAKAGGVIHGTATGTRVRPEDANTTEAQYQGQMDMYARRKLIDELVGTGVPVVSAADTGQQRSPALALLYLLIPIMAIAFLLANNDSTPAAAEGEHGGGEAAAGITLTAAAVQFDTDQLSWAGGEETTVTLHNEDSAPHNFSIYTDESAEEDLFVGQEVGAGASVDYAVDPLEAGDYFFRCDLHPTSMTGTVTIE